MNTWLCSSDGSGGGASGISSARDSFPSESLTVNDPSYTICKIFYSVDICSEGVSELFSLFMDAQLQQVTCMISQWHHGFVTCRMSE